VQKFSYESEKGMRVKVREKRENRRERKGNLLDNAPLPSFFVKIEFPAREAGQDLRTTSPPPQILSFSPL
jgi:hypothetical protein